MINLPLLGTRAGAGRYRAVMSTAADSALLDLLKRLERQRYRFVTPTPASHARVIARPGKKQARHLRDMLGWSLPFEAGAIDAKVEDLLRQADMLQPCEDGLLKSKLRVSSLHDRLFLHSAYPTNEQDSVFFGPDSYRFAALILAELTHAPLNPQAHVVDIGAGAGVGGIVAGLASDRAAVTLTDLNARALRLARINAGAAGLEVKAVEADDLAPVTDPIDLAVINPPYIIDQSSRAYRDGGGMYGGEVPLEMTRMAAQRLARGGRLILYTGAGVVNGRNPLSEAVARLAEQHGFACRLREIDPDVFGEELEKPAYKDVERIALIAAVLERPL
jgi:SAM-dependent methyltransferase